MAEQNGGANSGSEVELWKGAAAGLPDEILKAHQKD